VLTLWKNFKKRGLSVQWKGGRIGLVMGQNN
jgi:hypothetical protein